MTTATGLVWHRVAGDTDDTISAELSGLTLGELDITAAEAHAWRTVNGLLEVETLSAEATADGDLITATAVLSPAVLAGAGNWFVEWQVSFDGRPVTWPSGSPGRLYVRAQGA